MIHALKQLIPQPLKNIYHLAQAVAANIFFGFPSRTLRVVGITGTDGKTTTAQMIARILEEAGESVALTSTINFRINKKEEINATKFTTLSSWRLQEFLRRAADAGCTAAVIEVSSHSLHQNRVWGVRFFAAILTNITREHLDYHKTMAKYRAAKKILFRHAANIAVNGDVKNISEFLSVSAKKKLAYISRSDLASRADIYGGEKIETIVANNIHTLPDASQFSVNGTLFRLHIPGKFNIENALAAISAAQFFEVSLPVCAAALSKITGIPGRMEFVKNNRGITTIIDYAVTPNALTKLYETIQLFSPAQKEMEASPKIIAVFGACGERDRGKRPIIGEIVSRFADGIILTDEDPYYEDPAQIIREVAAGVKGKTAGENFFVIPDRKKAIQKALSLAKRGDTVVITGKGAEQTMAVREKRVAWSDREIVKRELGLER